MTVQCERLVVAIGKLAGTFVNDGLAVQVAGRVIALAGKRPAHEFGPRRAAGDFAAVFEFVAFANGRFHFLFSLHDYFSIFMDFMISLIEFILSIACLLRFPPGAGGCSIMAEIKIAECTLDFFDEVNVAS